MEKIENGKKVTPTKALDRETILTAKDLTTEKVDIPEWGGYVFVKEMTAAERAEWEYEAFVKGKEDEYQKASDDSSGANSEKLKRELYARNIRSMRVTLVAATTVDSRARGAGLERLVGLRHIGRHSRPGRLVVHFRQRFVAHRAAGKGPIGHQI